MSNFSSNKELTIGIVDDSPLIRKMIETVVDEADGMRVVGSAADPFEGREMIKKENPDVITLDVEMPRMNGIEFLDKIMKLRPMPVIMVSTLTQKGADITLQALEMGAVDYVAKPEKGSVGGDILSVFRNSLIPKLNAIKSSNFNSLTRLPSSNAIKSTTIKGENNKYDLIGIASSTGGVERLRYLISQIRTGLPPILIVQHINKMYVPSMVDRMKSITPPHITVKVAENMEIIKRNTIYFADNKQHLSVKWKGDHPCIHLIDEPPLNGFIASADYLFNSMARIPSKPFLGIILSGMGNDGAKGLLSLKGQGAVTVGEDQNSCLVYGMSKAASGLGALRKETGIQNIAAILNGKAI